MAAAEAEAVEGELRTSYAELFFDLVYVYAVTQVTALLLADTSAAGFARSGLMLALAWLAWSQHAWAVNAAGGASGTALAALLGAAGASLLMAQAIPDAYGGSGAWFAATYVAVRAGGFLVQWLSAAGDAEARAGLRTYLPYATIAPAVALAGGLGPDGARPWIWLAAVAIDVGAALSAGRGTFRVRASHFAERHALFVIVALGESLVAIGVATDGLERDLVLEASMAAAFVGATVLWWSYFGWVAAAAERRLAAAPVAERGRLARDLFTFLHVPIVAGIVLYAVAAKKAVGHPHDPLHGVGRLALAASFALFLGGFIAGNLRASGRVLHERLVAIVVVAIVAALPGVPGPLALLAAAAVLAVALALEARRRRAEAQALA